MRLKMLAAGCVAAVIAVAFAVPADAQSRRPDARQRYVPAPIQPTVTVYRTPEGRRYVVVHRRSYLDAGTEVYPGSQRYTDYIFPPTYSAYSIFEPSSPYKRWPLPGPFELGSYRAPSAY